MNPFREEPAEGQARRFTAQLVFTAPPENPEPNTTYCGVKKNGGRNPAVFNIYRTTDSVLGAMPPNNTGVLLPSITVHDAEGNETAFFDEIDPHPPGVEPPVHREGPAACFLPRTYQAPSTLLMLDWMPRPSQAVAGQAPAASEV